MIYQYGFSQIGPYHVEKGIPCQDSHALRPFSFLHNGGKVEGMVAGVADGLGSASHSQIGSSVAVETAVTYCVSFLEAQGNLVQSEKEMCSMIEASFQTALNAVTARSEELGIPLAQFDTTMDLVVYVQGSVFYGHVGDSGILLQNHAGRYSPLTKPDQDDRGRVFPLVFQDHWQFGVADPALGAIASVLLCTDGMWDIFFPTLLRREAEPLYVAQARFFMDFQDLGYLSYPAEEVAKAMYDYVENIDKSKVNDDKTVVVLCDDSIPVQYQEASYYASPDFQALQREQEARYFQEAYPHLVKKQEGSTPSGETPSLQPEATSAPTSAKTDTPSQNRASSGKETSSKFKQQQRLSPPDTASKDDSLSGIVLQDVKGDWKSLLTTAKEISQIVTSPSSKGKQKKRSEES